MTSWLTLSIRPVDDLHPRIILLEPKANFSFISIRTTPAQPFHIIRTQASTRMRK
jgi:hypothetical protein